jgi:hypothetical protein
MCPGFKQKLQTERKTKEYIRKQSTLSGFYIPRC